MEQNFIKRILERIKGRNIFLIGMMGCGKSAAGPELAKLLNYKHIDLDILIEKVANKSIEEIFESEGEKVFREIESQCLKETVFFPSLIVSAGGGVVLKPANWGHLRQGIVIWIDLNKEVAYKRLSSDIQNRPLLKGKDLKKIYDNIFDSRKTIYEQADLRVKIVHQTNKEVVEEILMALSKHISD